MDTVTNAAIVIAVVQAVKSLVPQVNGAVTTLLAACLGAGLALLQGVDPVTGAYQGLVAVGAVTVVDKATKK